MRSTLVLNAEIALSNMQIKGSHFEFSVEIIVIFQIHCKKMNSHPKIL